MNIPRWIPTSFASLAIVCSVVSCVTSLSPSELANEYYAVANAYFGLKDYQNAKTYYMKALELNPSLSQGQYNLIQILVLTDQFEEAKRLADELAAKDPENLLIMESAAYLDAKAGNIASAYEMYAEIYERGGVRNSVVLNLAILAEDLEHYDEAYEWAILYAAMAPNNASVNLRTGLLALRLDKEAEADTYLGNYETSIAENTNALSAYAARLERIGYYVRSLKIREAVTVKTPNAALEWFALARLEILFAGKAQEGLLHFAKALELGFKDEKLIAELMDQAEAEMKPRILSAVVKVLPDYEPKLPETPEPSSQPPEAEAILPDSAPEPLL